MKKLLNFRLTGEEPFKVNSREELYIKILKGDYDVESANYKKLSINAKDFIIKLLTVDPRKRMTVYQGLSNQWLLGKAASLKSLPLENMEALLTKKRREVSLLPLCSPFFSLNLFALLMP